jgi:hypothetical protein
VPVDGFPQPLEDGDVTFEVVVRFGRPFSVQLGGGRFVSARELTVPFANREAAEAAQREIEVSVRRVHDAGGEDYRVVVPGDVVESGETVVVRVERVVDALEGSDVDAVIGEQTARMRASILAPGPDLGDVRGDLARDTRDLAELDGLDLFARQRARLAAAGKAARCAGGLVIAGIDYTRPGHPRPFHAGRVLCVHGGPVTIGDAGD